MAPSSPSITQLLQTWRDGDVTALEQLTPLVLDELRRVARRYVAKYAPGRTLQTNDVVNEVFLHLAGKHQIPWHDRKHFFAACARMMRFMLIDRYRHGQRHPTIPLDDVELTLPQSDVDLLALDEALSRLETLDPRQSQIVELRYFVGLTVDEAAEVLGVGTATVKREWQEAKRWLYRELSGEKL